MGGGRQGKPEGSRDAPIAALYDDYVDPSDTLLSWSGDSNAAVTDCGAHGCACSDQIPTTTVSLWFTRLTYHKAAA